MRKVSIKELIRFRGQSEKAKKKFATDIKFNQAKPKPDSRGGDYWTIAVSAIAKSYKLNDLQIISNKIKDFREKLPTTKNPGTVALYKSNLELLEKYRNFDFKNWIPKYKTSSVKNYKLVLNINDLPVESSPQHVYVFRTGDTKQVGATWLISRKEGYKIEEMGMFTDILYRYLKDQFGKGYMLDPRYCIAVDLVGNYSVNYLQLQNKEIPCLLTKTIDEIKTLM